MNVGLSRIPSRSGRSGWAARLLLVVIRAYRWGVSPLLPSRCRFAPSCAAYAQEAIAVHGAARGVWLAVGRLLRCHPFHPGGFDPVPPSGAVRAAKEAG